MTRICLYAWRANGDERVDAMWRAWVSENGAWVSADGAATRESGWGIFTDWSTETAGVGSAVAMQLENGMMFTVAVK
jgi:hypothetical protein